MFVRIGRIVNTNSRLLQISAKHQILQNGCRLAGTALYLLRRSIYQGLCDTNTHQLYTSKMSEQCAPVFLFLFYDEKSGHLEDQQFARPARPFIISILVNGAIRSESVWEL